MRVDSTPARFDPRVLRLVAITDSLRDGVDGLAGRAAAAVGGGATMLQLRLKDESPRVLVEVARALLRAAPGVPLLVNARADVALAAGAHGVHLGIDDMTAAALRRVMPGGFIIGASVGDDEDVWRAEGADYVGIGPVHRASSDASGRTIGMARLGELGARCGVPVVAIGGITAENAATMLAAGASGIAVISAVFGAPDPMRGARALLDVLDASGR
jgi:thiamine-phosphate pyrophosphorylase